MLFMINSVNGMMDMPLKKPLKRFSRTKVRGKVEHHEYEKKIKTKNGKRLKIKLKKKIRQAFEKVYKLTFLLAGILLTKSKNIVVFESFHGKQYSDNPRAIYEYMKDNYPGYKLIWSIDRRNLQLAENMDLIY